MQPRQAVAVAFTNSALAVGTTLGPISLFMRPIAEELGVSLATVGSGASLIFMMMAVSAMINGPLLDRGRIRRTMLIGATLLTGALLGASRASTPWELGLCCVGMGMSIPMLGPLSGATLVGKVVDQGRGRALGIANIGAPAGAVTFTLLAGVLIENAGWRSTLAIYAGTVGLVSIPFTLLTLPKSLGSRPSEGGNPGLSPRELLGTTDFRLIAVAQGIAAGIAMGWAVHLAPYLQLLGATTPTASGVIAASSGLGVLGSLVFGTLVDRRSPRKVMMGVLLAYAAGFSLLALEPALASAIAGSLAMGFIGGGLMPVYTTLLAKRFGPESLGRAFGLTNTFMLPLGFGLPPLAGFVVTTRGSYAPVLWALVGLYALGVFSLTRVQGRFDR